MNCIVLLLDWEKAFDRIDTTKLNKILSFHGVPTKLKNLIQALYTHPTFRVQIEQETSSKKKQNTGIRQGCPLSPYLFILCMDAIFSIIKWRMEQVGQSSTGVSGIAEEMDSLLYADDT